MRGRTHSEETKAKMRGRIVSEETLANMRGRTHSEETKAKMRAAKLGRKHSEETKALMSASASLSRAGKRSNHSSETKDKIRKNNPRSQPLSVTNLETGIIEEYSSVNRKAHQSVKHYS